MAEVSVARGLARASPFQGSEPDGKWASIGPFHMGNSIVKRMGDEMSQGAMSLPIDGVTKPFEQINRQGNGDALLAERPFFPWLHHPVIGMRQTCL